MIDFDRLTPPPGAEAEIAAKKVITTVPLRKPAKTEFFRIRSGEEWTREMMMVKFGDREEDKYLVFPDGEAAPYLQELGLLKRVKLYVGITYAGRTVFLSEVPQREPDGTWNRWHETRSEIYDIAKEKWAKLLPDMGAGCYHYKDPEGALPEPSWPEQPASIEEAMNLAFRDRIIDDLEHPRMQELRGAVL